MSFTKVHQSAGSFDLDLRDDTPFSITNQLVLAIAGFAHLVVLPTRVPSEMLDWTSLKSLSIYTGVLRKRTSRTRLEGAHATIWLGDEDKKGLLEGNAQSASAQAFQYWVNTIRKGSTAAGKPQLNAGSVEALATTFNFPSPGYWWGTENVSRRDQLLDLCARYSAEFRVNDDLTLDAGTPTFLYGSTPTVMLTPTWEGTDPAFTSIRCVFDAAEDVEDWTSDVMYKYTGGGLAQLNGTHSYLNGLGTDALWQRVLDLDETKSSTDNAAIAAQQLGRFQTIRSSLDVTSDADAIMMAVRPGDRVYAWDPEHDVYDMTTTPVTYRGELIFPEKLTVQSVTMPATAGMGIYVRRGDGTIVDLSDWYLPEGSGARLQVGDRSQSLRAALRSRGLNDRA